MGSESVMRISDILLEQSGISLLSRRDLQNNGVVFQNRDLSILAGFRDFEASGFGIAKNIVNCIDIRIKLEK